MPDAGRTPEEERRREATAGFAAALRTLRAEAGDPSFRRMAAASGYISHTTLHEAATGARLPSWETTREFVKACNGDETQWRVRWDEAKNGPRPEPAEPTPVPELVPEPVPESASETEPEPSGGPKRRRGLLVIAAVLVFLGATVAAVLVGRELGRSDAPANAAPSPSPSPASNGPFYPGDQSRFVDDVTIPDGTEVKQGEIFTKVWQIENTGTVKWTGRFVQRDAPPLPTGDCQTPERVAIGDTLPNEEVKIAVQVQAPSRPMTCRVAFKMVDGQNRQLFPGSRPIFFEVIVLP
ncbi:hypothetical protein CFN78_13125 [Amycolatopsis antarctica]|uniref:Nbr1 FW domain-containing protein n=1 Tax=Amycolatopsis antarctica TaxID=1854586 RepID=A0A263D286_9PSEU|nr:NBR1-Ig-like domain-containing protein [Amycolatopsis antarctica]OZM72584.1 hypothetical protein CFN78_13125 [Amycolatopsis antarctica]